MLSIWTSLNVSYGKVSICRLQILPIMQGLYQNRILPKNFGPILPEYSLNRKDWVDSELIRL